MPHRIRRSGWLVGACVALLAASQRPGLAAEVEPEALLADQSVAYLRFDGIDRHRPAYEKTVLAGLIRTELDPLIQALQKLLFDALGPQVLSERLLKGVPPDELIKLQAAARQLPHLATYFKTHGVVAGVEVVAPLAGRFQITFVFPQGGQPEHRSAILGAVRLVGYLGRSSTTELKRGSRTILQWDDPQDRDKVPVKLRAWQEGEHVLLTISTEEIEHTLALLEGKRPNLTANAVLKRLAEFDDYETYARGFVDLEAILRVLEKPVPPAAVVAEGLGLSGLESFSFHLGFADEHQRSTFVLDTSGERKALLKLLSPPAGFSAKKRPPLPPDASLVAVAGFDFLAGYEAVLNSIDTVAGVFGPRQAERIKGGIREFETSLGIDLREDLLAGLGPTVVEYISPSEGPFIFGLTFAIEVKDEKKLKNTLDTLMRSIASLSGGDVSIRKRLYRGVELNMIEVGERGFPFVPTFAVHKGWLVASFYPQAVEGYVFRTETGARSWKPPALAQSVVERSIKNLEAAGGSPARVTAVSVSDPRPGLRQILSVAPLFVALTRSFAGGGGGEFDMSLIPNAQALTEPLGENVSVVVDNGKTIRIESYATFPVLLPLSGIDTYAFALPFLLRGF